MPTVGSTSTPSTGWFEQGVNTPPNQVAEAYTMPSPGGVITNLHAYFGLVANGPDTAWCCIWDNSGNLLASVAVSVANGTATLDGQAWYTGAVATPFFVASGATIYIGWAVKEADGFFSSYTSGGGPAVWNTQASPPASLSGHTNSSFGTIGAYADYVPAQGWIWNGTVWVAGPMTVYTGSFTNPTGLQVETASGWTNAT